MAAAAAAATSTDRRLKLFVNPYTRRVLFAQASGEAIEYLHSLLVSPHVSLPFDAATRNACIGNVYDSAEKLAAAAADISCGCGCGPGCALLQQQRRRRQEEEEEERFFLCGDGDGDSCDDYVADKCGVRCPSCGGEMAVPVPRGCPGASCSSGASAGGMKINGADLTCMLTDDLEVMPTTAGGALSLFTSFMMRFAAPGMVDETTVSLGYTEAIDILETSLQSSTVLTDVFLCKNKKARRFGKSTK